MDYSKTFSWYQSLNKPFWSPPSWIFGPVWTVLYVLIAISFVYVFYRVNRGKLKPQYANPFILNLVFNFAFSPIQFGLQNNLLASLDIILLLATLIWAIKIIYPKIRWVAYVNIPYLIWVSFATILQLTITFMNIR